ncbi:hypothetical protein D3C75_895320 [compost metagenome]
MTACLLIQHGVVNIHQAVNIVLLEQLQYLLGLLFCQRIGSQYLFLLEVVQIGAVTTNGGRIDLQCLIKRMDSHVMAAGDHHDFHPGSTGFLQCGQRLR